MAAETVLALDVGATHTRLALFADGRIGARHEHRTADLMRAGHDLTDALVARARETVAVDGARPVAIGVSLAATVDLEGRVLQPREFGIPGGPRLRDGLARGLGLPVAVDNDANLAALAEHTLGAARGATEAAVMTIGTNIGLGLILGNALHRGAHGAAGEVGLLLVPAQAPAAVTGGPGPVDAGRFGRLTSAAPRGYAWIEELVGGGALAAAVRSGGAPPSATRRVLTPGALEDPALRPLAERAIEGWAVIVADLQVLLDLQVVVLSGGVAVDASHLLPRLARRVAELVARPPEIRIGTLGPDAELIGAALSARAALAA